MNLPAPGSVAADRLARSVVRSVALVAAGALFFQSQAPQNPASAELVFLSSGQGDATLFRLPRFSVLVDCGPRNESLDFGERLIAPQLYDLGVRRLDMIMVTHPDGDHIGGLGSLWRRFRPRYFVMPLEFKDDSVTLEHLARAGIRPHQVQWVRESRQMDIGGFRIHLDCLPPGTAATTNEGSLVVKIEGAQGSALLMGDATVKTEAEMARRNRDWRAEILKVGHHGSRSSTSSEWLRQVQPREGIISCGRNNPYGHPHREVLDRLDEAGVTTRRTGRNLALIYRYGPTGFQLWKSEIRSRAFSSR